MTKEQKRYGNEKRYSLQDLWSAYRLGRGAGIIAGKRSAGASEEQLAADLAETAERQKHYQMCEQAAMDLVAMCIKENLEKLGILEKEKGAAD